MSVADKINSLECKIKSIFNKDFIRSVDVTEANQLLCEYKKLINWIEDETPIIEFYV